MRSYDFDNSKSNENGSADDYAEYQEFLRYKEAKRQYEQSVQQQTAPKTVSAPVNDSARERASAEAFVKEKAKMLLSVIVLIAVGVFAVMSYQKYAPARNQAPPELIAVSDPDAEVSRDAQIVTTPAPTPEVQKTYESILADYSARLREAAPRLVAEYQEEAQYNTEGLQGLATLCNKKIQDLAQIETDGVSEMASLMFKTGSGKYSEYEEWADKLYDVYDEEAGKIWDAYMASAQ